MDELATELAEETRTWRSRLDRALSEATASGEQGQEMLENVEAYRRDSDHFAEQGDLVRAFEAVVWAWAWLEIGARFGDVDWDYPEDWDRP